jgi:hypothetical protein
MEWAQAIFIIGIFTAILAAATIVVWQLLVTWRSRMSIAREEAYRKLAEQVVEAQAKTADSLETATADLADLRRRMAEVERMLKEVG